jgi:hypothetical protein
MPGNMSEPNGNWTGTGGETCMAVNGTEARGANGTWAWADANCTTLLPFMCRINGGVPPGAWRCC